ncbi:MAG TPA: SpoIVB peptidase S55 domain-containing protein [Actinomycetota bacterium]|nr:SpoIVB peptidase S55 domain-containing protein [Actinomycetota bacterium]
MAEVVGSALKGRTRWVAALLLATATLGAGLTTAPAEAQVVAPPECPEAMPVSEVERGMMATGWTVVEGKDPQPFDVEIKGIMPDGIAPGRDLIIIEASGPVIDTVGGIWYGMSGSPVYFEDRLIGAVSYGLSYGPSGAGGLTPAEDMKELLAYGDGEPGTTATTYRRPATEIPITPSVARMLGTEAPDEPDLSFTQLKVPLSVSGITGRPMKKLQNILEREGAPFVPYTGATSSAQTTTLGADLKAGGNFAAALSYGDLTWAGIGTTTFVCEGEAVAFGHPFFWDGKTKFGANDADSLIIVDDPVWGSYKLATVDQAYGTVDQDRLAGIRATEGELPRIMPVTSTVTAENTGRSRDGRTDILLDEYFPFLGPYHVYANIVSAFDQYSEGSADVTWTATGHTEAGEAFELSRTNVFASEWGIPWDAVSEMDGYLYSLFYNDFEEMSFDSLDVDVTVREDVERYRVSKVLVSQHGKPYRSGVRQIRVRRGDVIGIGVILKPFESTETVQVDFSLEVPADARRDGYISIGAGAGRRRSTCFYRPRRCARETGVSIDSFQELVDYLESSPRNNELRGELHLGRHDKVVSSAMEVLDQAISNRTKTIYVDVRGARRGGGGETDGGGSR